MLYSRMWTTQFFELSHAQDSILLSLVTKKSYGDFIQFAVSLMFEIKVY
jgi:hypothetical protein